MVDYQNTRLGRMHPRLHGAVFLHRRDCYMGFTEMKDRNSDVKGAGDPKSEGEKQKPTFECDHHIFKKARKLGPRPEGGSNGLDK